MATRQYLEGLGFNVSTKPYSWGQGVNSLANSLYFHSGNIADAVYADSKAIWDREDTAYQRMVADMKAAGLNPWTGVSSGGSPTSSTNPSMESLTSLISVLGGLLKTEDVFTRSYKAQYKALDTIISALGAVGKLL